MGGNVSENSFDTAISHFRVEILATIYDCFAEKIVMEQFVTAGKGYAIYESDDEVLYELAEFVVRENYLHHSGLKSIPPVCEIEDVCNEERRLINISRVLVARNGAGRIIGSIRITRWDKKTTLPLESLFGLNPLDLAFDNKVTTFWHIGRFSISKEGTYSTMHLMRTLMINAVYPIVNEVTGCLLAEVDRKLFNVLGKLGIFVHQLAPSIHYLASETIPVYSTSKAMMGFYERNKYLYEASV